jgi:formate dehydrogenase maturation protein FdhE
MLACGLCGEWWTGDRVQCPFCESTSRWARLAGEEDRIRWIETCDGCRGYVKTIDERQLPEDAVVMPLAESVRTLELDLAAEKFGCTPNLPYAALV